MAYVDGFVLAVPVANRDVYRSQAEKAVGLFKEFGAIRLVEAWGDDVPKGKLNDFPGAVQAQDDEAVLFSWIEYPDKATRDAASQRMMSDPRMAELGEMPFDGSRMIFSGFQPEVDDGAAVRNAYVDGFVLPVAPAKKDAYFDLARKASIVFLDHGAARVVEAWGDDVRRGEKTDYFRAALAKDDETVVFSWIEWPDKAARDAGMKAVMEDERMKTPPADMPFDGQRMIYGGFSVIVDQ
ncbi:MAG: uncharacterized protein JWR77_1630 [Rhizorhabdus sp.]|nr:uncharacterized protein [Rhizorhabdus sp.]